VVEGIDQSVRKKLLIHFNIFVQKAPVWYRTFVYGSYDTDAKTLSARMRRGIVNFVFDNLEWLPRIGPTDKTTTISRGGESSYGLSLSRRSK
jgi:hypothetical protein